MRMFLTGCAALAVLGLMTGVSQAFLVTHSTEGTLFYDDVDEAAGATMSAEVGTWGSALTELITGPVAGGPSGAYSGDTYLERGRGGTLSGASDCSPNEAIFTQEVSTGILHIEFMYWLGDDPRFLDANSVGIIDNLIGVGSPNVGSQPMAAYILTKMNANPTEWWDDLPNQSTGAPFNTFAWNKMEIDLDLDNMMAEVSINGVGGGQYATGNGIGGENVVGRVLYRGETGARSHFIDAVPEPATLSLLALGAVALIRRKRS